MKSQYDTKLREGEATQQAIRACEAKRDAATDPQSRRYYELCLVGWRAELAKIEAREGELRRFR